MIILQNSLPEATFPTMRYPVNIYVTDSAPFISCLIADINCRYIELRELVRLTELSVFPIKLLTCV